LCRPFFAIDGFTVLEDVALLAYHAINAGACGQESAFSGDALSSA